MSALRRRLVLCSLLGASACSVASCSSAPPSGIRVTIGLADGPPGWSTAFADHVSIIAEGSDGTRGVACLFPLSSGHAAESTNLPGEDPCADLHASPATLVPLRSDTSPDDWGLDTRNGVNVLARSGETIRVRAVAAWGGAALLSRSLSVRTEGSLAAGPDFPLLALSFQPNARSFVADCPGIDLSPEAIGSRGLPVDFPADACTRRAAGAARHSGVLARSGGGIRVPKDLPPACGETDQVVVWKTAPIALPPLGERMCAQITIEASFAACASGTASDPDCALTVQCTPPPTQLVLLASDGSFLPGTDQDMGCLPSANGPFTFRTEFAPVNLTSVAAAIEQLAPGGATDACFLDVKHFAVATVPCGN